ncbi:MAG: choice-of-anchor J domain-containing protein [Clostridia bacterium]|nr:choice-of-anchor J domain-containing protein [Clostridia bacterium]
MKKFFAFVIAFAMVLSLVTVPAMAETKKAADPRLTGTVPAVTVRDAADLNEALNVEGGEIEFVSEGAYPWVVSGDAAMSGNAGVASSESVLTATVEAAEGDIVQFEFQAWGEGSYTFWDHCDFLIDGNQQFTYGAYDNDWEIAAYALTAGEHTLTWSYTKDSSVNPSGDYFMVDNVYVGQPVAPEAIEVQDVEVPAGRRANVMYEVLPAEAFDKSVTFEIGNEEVATVDANGVVTGVAEGTTIVIVTSVADPTVSGSAVVHVTEALPTVNLFGFDTYDIAGTNSNQWIEFPDYDPTAYIAHGSMQTTFAAAFAGGNVYGYLYENEGADTRFYIMDAETYTVAYPGTDASNVGGVFAMAYNYATDVMYAITGTESRYIATVDLATGVATNVAAITGMANSPMTLAIDGEGNAYALDLNSAGATLYSLDLETGAAIAIGSTGVGLNYVQSMTFDIESNQLFWAEILDGSNSGLYTIDVNTGAASYVGPIGPSGGEIVGLYTKNDIEIAPIENPDVTVTFVDGLDNSVLGTMVVQAGTVLDEADFPEVPAHPGFEFVGWDYNGAAVYADTTITAQFHDPNSTIWDFETDPMAQGFEFIDEDGDGFNWQWHVNTGSGNHTTHSGDGIATSGSYDNDSNTALNPDNWMITPAFTGSSLSFWLVAQDTSYANDYLEVYVSEDGGQTWSDALWGGYSPVAYEQYTVNLSDYSGELRVAFRHFNCYDMFMLNVDDIEVSGGSEPQPTILGDVDGDGEVTIADALLTLRYCMGVQDLTDAQLAVADINGDGEVSLDDAILLLRLAAS